MPPNTVSVTRPGIFGNPFKAKDAEEAGYRNGPAMAVWAFREWLKGAGKHGEFASYERDRRQRIELELPRLRGKNLACFCAPGQPCHADVLLELASMS